MTTPEGDRHERVFVTGLGPVSSIGIGVDEYLAGLRSGQLGTSLVESFDPAGFPHKNAGEVKAFDSASILRNIDVSGWGRSSRFAAAAARLAFDDSACVEFDPSRCAAVVGTTSGESQEIEKMVTAWVDDPEAVMSDADGSRVPASRLSAAVNRELGFGGEALTISTACSASNYAIGYAYDLICSGQADLVVAGGADSVCRWAHAGFYRLGALTEDRCSPFDENRSGILTGEGGAALVLEGESHARVRNAKPYAEIRGYALSCDAHHMVSPNQEGITRCMTLALEQSGTEIADVDYICAHGTGTATNDSTEGQAVLEVYGDDAPPISSIKSMLGHTMGAASGFGAIASALAILHSFVPPTINHTSTDHRLASLNVVPNNRQDGPVKVVQNHGFAFGGNNAIVILGAVA